MSNIMSAELLTRTDTVYCTVVGFLLVTLLMGAVRLFQETQSSLRIQACVAGMSAWAPR
jgi:uncharacterized membrane protein YdcZ (DUF606 family)